jgi:hypothetical protein
LVVGVAIIVLILTHGFCYCMGHIDGENEEREMQQAKRFWEDE